jgi:hypothetical protein
VESVPQLGFGLLVSIPSRTMRSPDSYSYLHNRSGNGQKGFKSSRSHQWTPFNDREIPPENYLGVVLGGKYQITFQYSKKEHVGVYSVKNLQTGKSSVARVFELCQLPDSLYLSSKRRVKRLRKSDNFEDDFRDGCSRYLISSHSRGLETPHPDQAPDENVKKVTPHDESKFVRGPSPCHVSVKPLSDRSWAEVVSRPSSLGPACRNERSDTIDGFPVSRKGYRQRARRQKKRREERRRRATYVNGEHTATPEIQAY